MKVTVPNLIIATVLVVSATSANAQTLGSAANYDIFAQEGGDLELKDANQLFGKVGLSNGSELDGKGESNSWNGTIFKHTGATITDGGDLNPSGGIQSSAAINAALNQANVDLTNYIGYLNGLTADESYGDQTSSFSYTSTMGVTVLDFDKVDLEQENFTLTGRAGGTDQFIIRTSDFLEFKDSDLILNNVSVDNVIWYHSGTSNFDLHQSGGKGTLPADFMKFAGTVIAPDAEVRLGEIDFTGSVFGTNLKLGSGFKFEGNHIPEPSSSLMLLIGAGALLLVRRRKP